MGTVRGGNYLGGNCPGGTRPGGSCLGGNCPGGSCPVTNNSSKQINNVQKCPQLHSTRMADKKMTY